MQEVQVLEATRTAPNSRGRVSIQNIVGDGRFHNGIVRTKGSR